MLKFLPRVYTLRKRKCHTHAFKFPFSSEHTNSLYSRCVACLLADTLLDNSGKIARGWRGELGAPLFVSLCFIDSRIFQQAVSLLGRYTSCHTRLTVFRAEMKRTMNNETMQPRKRLNTAAYELSTSLQLMVDSGLDALDTGNIKYAEKQLMGVLVMGDPIQVGERSLAGHCLLVTALHLVDEGRSSLADDLMTTTTIVACENGFHRTLRALLEYKGTNPVVGFHYPLRVASERGYPDVVAVLLADERVDPNAAGGRATSRPFVLACEKGHLEVVRHFLSHPAVIPDINESEALRLASKYGHVTVVEELLLDGRCDPNSCNSYSLIWACNNGHPEVVKVLLNDDRTDPSIEDNRAIIHASCNGHVEVVRNLLSDERVSPEAQNNSSLVFASFRGHTEVVRELLNSGRVDPSAQGNMSLIMACVSGHTEVVEELLVNDRVDPACGIQRVGMLNQELVRVLDACRVKVSERLDNLPLLAACEGGHSKIVRLLLNDSRIDPTYKNYLAMKLASKSGYLEIVKMLLSDDRVDPKTAGKLAGRKAHSYGYDDIVTHLLLDPRVNPSLGVTVLALAIKRAIFIKADEQ